MSVDEITSELGNKVASDGTLDYIQLIQQTGTIGRITGTLYAVLSTIILVLVPFIVAMEVMYICFPILRIKTEEMIIKVEGKGIASRVIGFTLRDAREAVFKADTAGTGKSAMTIYLIQKCKSLYIVMFILCLVLNGSGPLTRVVWNLIARIIDTIF